VLDSVINLVQGCVAGMVNSQWSIGNNEWEYQMYCLNLDL